MTQLFTVHFTTKHLVSKFDDKGKKIGEYEADIPQTVTALPHSTALGYKKFGNFRMEPYYTSVSQRPYEAKKARTEYRGAVPNSKAKAPVSRTTTTQSAAASGNLAAAINAGAK